MNTAGLCVCGCARDVHDHYHAATYCGRCGGGVCPRYQRARPWWKRRVTG